jgi:hypothetical protein
MTRRRARVDIERDAGAPDATAMVPCFPVEDADAARRQAPLGVVRPLQASRSVGERS